MLPTFITCMVRDDDFSIFVNPIVKHTRELNRTVLKHILPSPELETMMVSHDLRGQNNG